MFGDIEFGAELYGGDGYEPVVIESAVTFSGTGTLTFSPNHVSNVAVTFNGVGTFAIVPTRVFPASADPTTFVQGDGSIRIKHPDGTIYNVDSASFSLTVSSDIKWSAMIPVPLPLDWADNAAWTLIAKTTAGDWTSMPLVVTDPEVSKGEAGGFTSLGGRDLTSWRLDTEGFSQETFTNKPAAYILHRIGQIANVRFVAAPQVVFPEYDLKGGTLLSHVSRVLRDAGHKYRIGGNGEVVCIPIGHQVTTGRPLLIGNSKQRKNLSAKVDYIRLRKSSKLTNSQCFEATFDPLKGGTVQSALSNPLDAATLTGKDSSTNGSVNYALFYDGPINTGRLCRYIRFSDLGAFPSNTTTTSNKPAQAVLWGVLPPLVPNGVKTMAKFCVTGIPPGTQGYDLNFEVNYPARVPTLGPENPAAGRLRVRTVETTLWPTKAFVLAIAAAMWQEEQKSYETVTRTTAPVNPFIDLGDEMTVDADSPGAIIESSSWTIGDNCSHTVIGYVPRTPPGNAQAVVVSG